MPHFMSAYTDLDQSGSIVDLGGEPLGDLLNPSLLTFPMVGEYKATIDAPANFTPRPIQCSVEQAIEWLYRIRQWRAEINIPSGPGSEWGTVSFALTSGISDEIDILDQISEPNYIKLTFYGTSSESDIGFRSYSANATLDLFIRVQAGNVPNHAEQEFKPYQVGTCTNTSMAQILVTMRLRVAMTVYDSDTLEQWDGVSDSWDDSEPDEYTDTTADLHDKALNIRWPWIGFTSGSITYLESAPDVSILPDLWWEYSDGTSPIWDSSSGAQLRSVVTGELI